MKSLQESLFDDDLVTKEIRLRDAYEMLDTPRGITGTGFPIGQMFDGKKLEKYPNPYHCPSGLSTDSFDGFIGIIADQEVPELDKYVPREKWRKNLKKTLTPYIKRAWKKEWDDKIEIVLSEYANGYLGVVIDFDLGAGSLEFIFKQNN